MKIAPHCHKLIQFVINVTAHKICQLITDSLQCFDTVGWVTGSSCGL